MDIYLIVFALLIILGIITILFMFRNEWVCKVRVAEIVDGDWDSLPSYEYMLYHFWIWDIEKFKGINA